MDDQKRLDEIVTKDQQSVYRIQDQDIYYLDPEYLLKMLKGKTSPIMNLWNGTVILGTNTFVLTRPSNLLIGSAGSDAIPFAEISAAGWCNRFGYWDQDSR